LPLSISINNGKNSNPTIDLLKSPGSITPKFDAFKKFNDFFDNSESKKKGDLVFDMSIIKKKSAGNGIGNFGNLNSNSQIGLNR